MGIARSTFYDKPAPKDDTAIVETIAAICEEFEFYGWRRVRAELRHRGLIVNHKKIRRLMREHDLQPRRRRRYVATTDSDHDQAIDPNRAKNLTINGPDRKHPVRTAGGSGQAASLTALGFQFQGRSCLRSWMV